MPTARYPECMPVEYDELSPLAKTYLGVVAAGLPTARLAGDESFRIDYLTAVCWAVLRDRPAETHLEGDGPQPRQDFLDELRSTIADLDARGVIIAGAGDGHLATMPFLGQDVGGLTSAQIAKLDLNQSPKVLDSFLAYRALDELLGHDRVYAVLMEKYGESSEIWQRLSRQGYGR